MAGMVQLGTTTTCALLRMTMQVTLCVVTECKIMLYVNVPAESLDDDRSINLVYGNLDHVKLFLYPLFHCRNQVLL